MLRLVPSTEAMLVYDNAVCLAQGLLSTKVIHKQDRLAAVNRGHELYSSYAPAAAAGQQAEPEAAAASRASTSGRITITYSYR